MFKPAADAWALEVARQTVNRESFETTHIELKSEVPDPRKFVRQFAGLANAARWHPVLVLFGLDQQRGLVGVRRFEVGDWYQSLRALFEYGEAPSLVYQNFLSFEEKLIAAFVFETDSPPYVVGDTKQGGPRDVPWRYGSNTGFAGRRELLSLLLRRIADPEVEFSKIELRLYPESGFHAHIELFVYPAPGGDELVIPNHRVHVHLVDSRGDVQQLPREVTLRPISDSSRAKWVDSTVVVPAASKLQLRAKSEGALEVASDATEIQVSLVLQPARVSTPIRFSAVVSRREHPDCAGYWELPEHHALPLHTNADAIREIEQAVAHLPPRTNWNPFGTLPPPRGWE